MEEIQIFQENDQIVLFESRKVDFDLVDVLKLSLDFDWRLNACDFFNVDLQLLSGVSDAYLHIWHKGR